MGKGRLPPAAAAPAQGDARDRVEVTRDWFALWNAAGVLADATTTTQTHWAESSSSTTAALTGDAALMTLRSPTSCYPKPNYVPYFSGDCMPPEALRIPRNTFTARQVQVFAAAVRAGVQPRLIA